MTLLALPSRFKRARLPQAMLAACLIAGSSYPAFAQQAVAQSAQQQVADYNIPAGTLDQALNKLAATAGILLAIDSNLTQGKQSSGLKGRYTPEEALNRLLAGSGLQAVPSDAGGYKLKPVPTSGAAVLPAVNVNADDIQESAYSPVDGYVAKRSATGTKSDMPVLETPQSISIITREQVDIQGSDSLDKVFSYSAGIYSTSGSGQELTGTSFSIRGFNAENREPLFLNGSRYPLQTLSGPEEMYFYERIEILKGPASILYGQASPGGLVNLVSKRPTPEQRAEMDVLAGSWERKQIKADVSGPIADSNEWGYRVTGLVRDSETMIEEIPDDRQAFSGAFSWTPSNRTSLNLQTTYQKNETMFLAGLPADGTVLKNPNGKIANDFFQGEPGVDEFEVERQTIGYQFEHSFNDTWAFRQNGLWYDTRSDYTLLGVFRDANSPERRSFNRFAQDRIEDEEGFSIDNQLQAKWLTAGIEHVTLLGVDYSDGDFLQRRALGSAAPIDVFDPVYGTPVTFGEWERYPVSDEQTGVYFQDQMKFAQRWVVLLGGRWDQSEVKGSSLNGAGDSDEDAFTSRAGLVYLFDNGVAPYVSYSESFQPQSGLDFQGRAFEPTTGEQIEAGIKYEPAGYNALVTLSTYKIVQQNILTTDLDHPGFSVQQGEVESQGAELEARAKIDTQWDLIATYAYNDNVVTKSNDEAQLGMKQVSQPRNMAAVWLDYDFLQGILPNVTIGGGIRYVNGLFNSGNTVELPSYTVVDTALQYHLEQHWKFQLNVNNVFDKEYVSACGYNCFYGDERNFTLSANYSW